MSVNGNFSQIASIDYEKVKEIFSIAVELTPAERIAFLDKKCPDEKIRREVESLLEARDEAENFLNDVSAIEVVQDSYGRSSSNKFIGRKIDKYLLTREIGHGGMGICFLRKEKIFTSRSRSRSSSAEWIPRQLWNALPASAKF